jgi:phosphohistidine phosphatase
MTRTLLVLRHGEAANGPKDFDRPLTDKGSRQAYFIGTHLRQHKIIPDIILHSSVPRVLQTMKSLIDGLQFAPVHQESCGLSFYQASSIEDLHILTQTLIPSSVQTALMIGHNPWIYEYAGFLAEINPTAAGQKLLSGYPPATLSIFKYSGEDWSDIHPDQCELQDVVFAERSI